MNLLLFFIGIAGATPLDDLRVRTRADEQWRSPTVSERQAAVAAVDVLGRDRDCQPRTVDTARELLGQAGLELDRVDDMLLVHDAADPHGSGLLALRCGSSSPLVWQAPHSFHDLGTGTLAVSLFVEGDARAALWNTTHRYRSSTGEDYDAPVHPADVAHEPGNLFHAMTVALAAADTSLRFVQLHGFAKGDWDAIISSGDAARPPVDLGRSLSPTLGRVAVFGHTAEVLGGTTNVQGRALRRWPALRFAHVELSVSARDRLADDAALRRSFATAFGEDTW